MIVKNSVEESNFLAELKNSIRRLNTKYISSKEVLVEIVQEFTDNTKQIWFKHLKIVNITRYLKSWWNKDCQKALKRYRVSKLIED